MFLDTFAEQIKPRPKVRMLDWCRRHVQNENGRPYDHNAYPHLGAPGGPCDAFDDPTVREIVLQFASRLGKTFFGQSCHMFTAGCSPAPCMFVSASEKITGEIIARTYTLLENNSALSHELNRPDRRKQDCIELANCRVFVGWARSVTTLADKNVKVGHANEIDKWDRPKTRTEHNEHGELEVSGSTEGDPLDLFLDRAKDFPNYKYILESTPSVADISRVERRRLKSSNCSFWVPCPRCKKYQVLKFPRMRIPKAENGDWDADLAFRTAFYPCEACNSPIQEHDRAWTMRFGVWVPEGCAIDHGKALETATERREALAKGTFSDDFPVHYCKQPYVIGEPSRDGLVAGFQLSSLCALSLSWGKVARTWVESEGSQTSRWNFINQWLGETWRLEKRTEDWESIGRRLIIGSPRYEVPLWASILTCGIDRQLNHYKYEVVAWGPGSTCHVVDYGVHEELDWIHRNVVTRKYAHADGDSLQITKTLIDSGYNPAEPYQYSHDCLSAGFMVLCCKGSSVPLGTPFRDSELSDSTLMPGLPLIMVDPNWTQGQLERRLTKLKPGDSGALSLFSDSVHNHKDFLKQLLNDEPESKKDARGNTLIVWNRATSYPNDYRDCFRYADVAHLLWADGGAIPSREQLKYQVAPSVAPRLRMDDGRPFLVTERT